MRGRSIFESAIKVFLHWGRKRTVYKDLINAEQIGQEKCNEFVKELLVNGTVGFFEAIKKNNLKTEIVKIKKTNKVTGRKHLHTQ